MKFHGNFRAIQLDNKFGITDQFVIGEAEALFSTMAAIEGIPDGNFDVHHLKAIHKHVLGDMYDWAGEFRTAEILIGPGAVDSVAPPALIEKETERVLRDMSNMQVDGMPAHEFADRMAGIYTRLYAISPFPDGNARAARYLIDKFADQNDMEIRWDEVPADAFTTAVEKALAGNGAGLRTLLRYVTDYKDLYDMHNVSSIQAKVSGIVEQAGLSNQVLPSQAITTHQELQRMAAYAKLEIARDLDRFSSGQNTVRDWFQTSTQHALQSEHDRQKGHQLLSEAINSFKNSGARPPGLS